MIGFMFLSLLLIIVVLWLIAPALLGKRTINKDDTDSQNTAIAKERLSELEHRLEQGELSQQEFEQTQIEIEKSLLEDIHDGEATKISSPKIEKNAYVIMAAIPLMALALYWLWGMPDSINLKAQVLPQTQSSAANGSKKHLGSVDEMALLLESRLEKDPSNPDGWYTLARTYMSLKKYDRAVVALKRLRQLVGDDVTVLITLADAMTMERGGRMIGEPFELIKKALEKKPNNPMALWLAGLGYAESGDGKTAIKLWKKLLPIVAKEPRSVEQIQSLIVAAERKMGLEPTIELERPSVASQQAEPTSGKAVVASIRVTVKLADGNKGKVSPDDFVLVYARAAKGPKMPLAIVRKQVKDLPITVVLDDSMAMQPTMKLSNFTEVTIIARVSKLGQAVPQSGDLQGLFGPVTVKAAEPVTVLINKVLP
ncbi:Cytochrome c heme lyase subunit CcmH [hydrothermal vent metagenome]|uniref:Cytochrome c heme lyase subunit CcmH n=1 Tax=hydrothermal vent metagenome TaxID=652676 RepID=A0A3B0ZYK2_9ZZZZ